MFRPKYVITDGVSMNMRKIGELIGEFNTRKLAEVVLVRTESEARALSSYSSTSIEGNTLGLTDVKKILKSSPKNIVDTEREVLNYNRVLEMLDEKIKGGEEVDIMGEFVCKIQSMVVDGLLPKSHIGQYRLEPVFINDPRKGRTVYLPPDVGDVSLLMDELLDFVERSRGVVDPLIVAGIFHKQMVIIHPFMDGNGRTTRLVTKALLARLGINTFPLFSFENFYNENISLYFQKVGLFGNYYDLLKNIDFTHWLEYFTDGIIDELKRVLAELPKQERNLNSWQKKIVEYIEKNGSITPKGYAGITKRARSTRIKDFKDLVDMKIITPVGSTRSRYYVLA